MSRRASARPGRGGRPHVEDPSDDDLDALAAGFAALGPDGPDALAELWRRPRLRPHARTILDMIVETRRRIVVEGRTYHRDLARREREHRTPPLSEYEPSGQPGLLIRRQPPDALLRAFWLDRGRGIADDCLAELSSSLRALRVPARGAANVCARLVALARPPRQP